MDNSIPSKALAKSSAAACIRREWNGPLTSRGTARLAPAALQASIAAVTALDSPAMTTCPGALKFAGLTSPLTWSQHCAIALSSNPSTAAMEPWPSGTAACISSPRRRTRAIPSVKLMAPAQTRAEYSPRL